MAKIKVDADSKQGAKAFDDLAKSIAKAGAETDKATKSSRELERAALQIVKSNEGPLEKHNRKMQELGQLVAKGKLEYGDAEKAALRYAGSLQRVEGSGTAAFGSPMLAKMQTMLLAYNPLQDAIRLTTKLLGEQAQRAGEAAEAAVAASGGLARGAQLAATSADPTGEFDAFVQESVAARMSGAVGSIGQGGELSFDLRSSLKERRDRDFAVLLQSEQIVEQIGPFAQAYSAIETTLGRKEIGDFRGMFSKGLAAAGGSPSYAQELVQSVAPSGGSAGRLGLADEFLLAASAYLSKSTGSATEGGTQLRALLAGVEKVGITRSPELKGLSGIDLIKNITGRKLDRVGLAKLLGDDQGAIAAADTLGRNLAGLEELQGAIYAGERNDLAQVAIDTVVNNHDLRAAGSVRRAEGRAEALTTLTPRSRMLNLFRSAQTERQTNRDTGEATGGFFGDTLDKGLIQSGLVADSELRNALLYYVGSSQRGENRLTPRLEKDILAELVEIRRSSQATAFSSERASAPQSARAE